MEDVEISLQKMEGLHSLLGGHDNNQLLVR